MDILGDIFSNYTLITVLVLSVIMSPVLIITTLILKREIENNKTKSLARHKELSLSSQKENIQASPNSARKKEN